MKLIKGAVTAPKGYLASGIKSGIKMNKLDLALIVSKVPAVAAGVFTKNKLKAAPIRISQKHLQDGWAQAIIVNSGNANCLTGKRGLEDALKIVSTAASKLWVGKEDVLIASTGVIGKLLPLARIEKAIPRLVKGLSRSGGLSAAKAIMTTDLVPKTVAVAANIGGRLVKIGGIAKGSGMICPDMATMLCFITTDADIELKALKNALRDSAEDSFNSITVDGDMSTNDAVFIMANGLAGNPKIKYGTGDYRIFSGALSYVSGYLAREIVNDGEGASKFVEIEVTGAKTKTDAKKVALKIANSNLVKTAIAGEDPNIGRIAAAAGAAGIEIEEQKLDIYIGKIKIVAAGRVDYKVKAAVKRLLRQKKIAIRLNLNSGREKSTVWTCDLTEGYIRINARYN